VRLRERHTFMMSSREEFHERIENEWIKHEFENNFPVNDLKEMLDSVGIRLPKYKVRELTLELQRTGELQDDAVDKMMFLQLCDNLEGENVAKTFKTSRQHDKNAQVIAGQMGAQHMVLNEEQVAFSDWMNNNLGSDKDVNHLLPLNDTGSDMYQKMDDGIILCKMINLAAADTIDERVINKGAKLGIFKQHENLTLAINSAKAIGCVVIGIDSHTLNSSQGKKWLVLGLVWQLIKMYLFKQITISQVPGLVNLLRPGETLEDLMKMSPEEILLRWVNHQLEKAGSDRRIRNFHDDIKDSEIYTELINQIAPQGSGVNKEAMTRQDLLERAELMLDQADKIQSRAFVTAKDVVKGQEKLNLAFVANLFNNFPALDPPKEEYIEAIEESSIQETREEKMYRNWMNSLGVNPTVNYLYSDLCDGLIIFQLMDFIRPGIVDWKRVKTLDKMSKMAAKRLQEVLGNCNYAVELGKKLNFSLVGIAGSDIMEGNRTLTLALVWQLMRAYTLALLSQLNSDNTPIVESEIIAWANNKLNEKGVTIRHFQDKTNKTALPIIHLIDVIKPGVIDYSIVLSEAQSPEECMSNAKYAITMARKIGAPVYALPEDITEVKHKMVMTVYASLMLADIKS